MGARDDARLVMETIAELHRRGYGRLKLFSYTKEGISAWRHCLFASDQFPQSLSDLPKARVFSSIPWFSTPTVQGRSAADAADKFIAKNPELMSAAHGVDPAYVAWFANMLEANPNGILDMESPFEAFVDGSPIEAPYGSGDSSSE
jgi:hypothetical protein